MLILVDIDLTLSDARPRLEAAGLMPHRDDKASFQRWLDTLQSDGSLLADLMVRPMRTLLDSLGEEHQVVYLTGRSEIYREATARWLFDRCGFTWGPLYMRGKDDWRSAREYKEQSVVELMEIYGAQSGIAVDDDSEGDCGPMYLKHGLVHLKVFLPEKVNR